MSSTLCTICARGGSKGVKNKNLRKINGIPLVGYSVRQAVDSGLFDHIVLSTDLKEIQDAGREFGAEVFFTRSADLSDDKAAKIPVIRHAFEESESHFKKKFDYLVDLDATSPLRNQEDIKQALELCIVKNYANVITVTESRRSPYFNMVEIDAEGRVNLVKQPDKKVVRRQDVPRTFDMNASIYVWKRETILNEDSIFLENTGLYIMPHERSLDVDSEFDFEIVNFLLGKSSA